MKRSQRIHSSWKGPRGNDSRRPEFASKAGGIWLLETAIYIFVYEVEQMILEEGQVIESTVPI